MMATRQTQMASGSQSVFWRHSHAGHNQEICQWYEYHVWDVLLFGRSAHCFGRSPAEYPYSSSQPVFLECRADITPLMVIATLLFNEQKREAKVVHPWGSQASHLRILKRWPIQTVEQPTLSWNPMESMASAILRHTATSSAWNHNSVA